MSNQKIWNTKLPKWIGLGLILFAMAFSTSAFANQDMKPKEMQTVIEQARDAWEIRDAEAIAQLFTPDGELIVPGQRWQGQAEIRAEVSRFAQQYSNVKIVIRRMLFANNQAAVEWYYEDTENATGIRNKADDAIIVDFKDGRISRWREYFDTKTPVSKSR